MTIDIHLVNGVKIAEIRSPDVLISETQDALDLMGESTYLDSRKMILHEKNVIPDFFDLKTGIAGDILQKFSTYNIQLAIVGDFSKYSSKSLKEFIYESNKIGRISFVNSVEEAKIRLAKFS